MLSSKQMWQKDNVPVSVSSLQTLQTASSFRSMFSNCSSSSMIVLFTRKEQHKTKVKDSSCWDMLSYIWVDLMLAQSTFRWFKAMILGQLQRT